MIKRHLASPGPTPLPPEVSAALALPMIYHRGPVFTELMAQVRQGLQSVLQTKSEVAILTASGTGGMEAAIANLTSPKDKVLTIEAGKFGERWTELAQMYGCETIVDKYEYGAVCDPARVEALLKQHPEIKLICVQACETSTGVVHPIRELARLASSRPQTALAVDAITGLGVFDLPMDAWGIDVLLGGSQKALMLPPGLAFVALSEKAWGLHAKSKQPRYYFDLDKTRKSQEKNQNAFTPGVNLIQALRVALQMMQQETLPKVFARHEKAAQATRAAIAALGLELFSRGNHAPGVTAVKAPTGIGGDLVVKAFRDKHGVTIAGGQGSMKGQIFRLSHMGFFDFFDVIGLLSTLETVLWDLGYQKFESGVGVAAAQRILAK